MGNKLSCSCAPLIRKAYRYEDSPWNNSRRRDGHLLRSANYWLWAEVFHVSSSTGAARWQQVSEDLVPVNITCVQDSPECIFHITAYNSQVEKILDNRILDLHTTVPYFSKVLRGPPPLSLPHLLRWDSKFRNNRSHISQTQAEPEVVGINIGL
ncbi:protein still life, isoform SIF type 1 [Trichonephila clavata]|uniref:Protein still life, isoform SIF type 1 n=1 Tax=Trichonephila clavata TaxID=2740835 RepID=A0A8X6LD31_TRICU|nr:protein still life, isoform SIF type 1 [Trichonephila clavata]